MMTKTIPLFSSSEAGGGSNSAVRAVSVLALAIAACWPVTSQALSLGKINVVSALGEPLQAEIDVNEITTDEISSLRIMLASPDTFKTAGLEYNSVLSRALISMQRRPDGRFYFRLQSDRVVNDPFIDLIIEANWSAGRIVRDYTLLFDPRNLMSKAPVAPQLPLAQPATPATMPEPIRPSVNIAPIPKSTQQTAKPKLEPVTGARQEAKAAVKAARPAATTTNGKQTVKNGDTAGRIAQTQLKSGVSLEQLLASMLRTNPDAFIGGNINRIKAGVVIDTPDADQASKIDAQEAKKILVASSKDFAEYKRRVAQSATLQPVEKSGRQSVGQAQAKVEDKAKTATSPDKLKLSKGQVQAPVTSKLDAVAQNKKSGDTQARTAELNKNISDLGKVAASVGILAPTAAKAPTTSLATAVPLQIPGKTTTVTTNPVVATVTTAVKTTTTSPALTATAVASAATATTTITASAATVITATTVSANVTATAAITPRPRPVIKPASVPAPEPSLLDSLTDDPVVPLGAAGVIAALLGGFVFWRKKRRTNSGIGVDSSFLESRLQPDSFFGASGGQQVDTSESPGMTGSSMIYSPSQLDAAGDVDPVAEAEVYIAYGRDLQAEEILKEALRTQSNRVAIHVKLLEIYAKRRDTKAFQLVAREVYDLTGADGTEWQYVCQMGRDLDPTEQMYHPGGKPMDPAVQSIANSSIGAASFAASTIPQQLSSSEMAASTDVDLDLDLDLFAEAPAEQTFPIQIEPTMAIHAVAPQDPGSVDFDIAVPEPEPAPVMPPSAEAPSAPEDHGLSFDMDDFPSPAAPTPAPTPVADSNALSFDLGGISLDLPSSTPETPAFSADEAANGSDDPMNTKLELATEFFALGDVDGARSIAQEVANDASGGIKAKAMKLLSQWV